MYSVVKSRGLLVKSNKRELTMRRVFLSTVQSADIVITCHPTVQRNYHKQTFLMMLIYLPTIVHNQSLLWWNVNRIQKVMQSCKKKGWWIENGDYDSFDIIQRHQNCYLLMLLSPNGTFTDEKSIQNVKRMWSSSSITPKSPILHSVWKITENIAFNIASEASYVYILSSLKMQKNGQFCHVFENLKLEVKQCFQTGQF